MLLIAVAKPAVILMGLFIVFLFLFFALMLRGATAVDDEEERPCADRYVDYSERPFISKEQYN